PHGDAATCRRGVAGARVDDVVVALAVDEERVLVVAGGGEGVIRELDDREELVPVAWIRDASGPWRAVGLGARSEQIAARLRNEALDPSVPHDRHRAIDGITLGDAA